VKLAAVISRDGSTCVWCGRTSWPGDLTVEHLLPKTRGGRGIPENLAVACRSCNRRRGAKPVGGPGSAEHDRLAGQPLGVELI
jgi:5-methylcytosine-specific restriction endonuclease McrA